MPDQSTKKLIPGLNPYDSGYGFFDDGGDEEIKRRSSSCSSRGSLLSNLSSSSWDNYAHPSRSTKDLNIVCEIEDEKCPVFVRYFFSGESVSTSIEGFRIVQDQCGEDSEFKVNLDVNGTRYSAWRRHADFAAVADACADFVDSNQCMELLTPDEASRTFRNTLRAWYAVQNNRRLFETSISPQGLVEDMSLLRLFVQHLLHEIPTLHILWEFVQN